MRCGSTRRGAGSAALALGLLAFVLLAAGCGATSAVSHHPARHVPPLRQQVSQQERFKARLIRDIKSLDSGVLGYKAPSTLATGSDATLSVTVTDIGRGKNGTRPLPSGWVYSHEDVPTGGYVKVTAACQEISCHPDNQAPQPVLRPGMRGNWSWQLSAQHPGTAHVSLTATTYDQGTNLPLHVTQAIQITITVSATPGYWVSQAGNWTKVLIGIVGFGTIVGGVQWLWRHRRKRKAVATARDKAVATAREAEEDREASGEAAGE